jgi:hypothetical protein
VKVREKLIWPGFWIFVPLMVIFCCRVAALLFGG